MEIPIWRNPLYSFERSQFLFHLFSLYRPTV